jgi:hypothetical protein
MRRSTLLWYVFVLLPTAVVRPQGMRGVAAVSPTSKALPACQCTHPMRKRLRAVARDE